MSNNFQVFVQVLWKFIATLVLYLSLLKIKEYQSKGEIETEQDHMSFAPHILSLPFVCRKALF